MREMCQNEGAMEDSPSSPLTNRTSSSHAPLTQQESSSSFSYGGGDPFYDRFPWYVGKKRNIKKIAIIVYLLMKRVKLNHFLINL